MTHVLIGADVLKEVRRVLTYYAEVWESDEGSAATDALSRLPDEGRGEPFERRDGQLVVNGDRVRTEIGDVSHHFENGRYIGVVATFEDGSETATAWTYDNARAVALALLTLTTGPRDGGTDD